MINTILENIAYHAPKEVIGGGATHIRLRADTRSLCGDYTVYKLRDLGFDDLTPDQVAESAASKQALYQALLKQYNVEEQEPEASSLKTFEEQIIAKLADRYGGEDNLADMCAVLLVDLLDEVRR